MFRTDLAIDKKEQKNAMLTLVREGGIKIHKTMGKGDKHITVSFPQPDLITDSLPLENAIGDALKELLGEKFDNLLVVGLGNGDITPDSVGPIIANSLLATRHIVGDFAERIGLKNLRSVSVIRPNVLGKTGMEAAELVESVVARIKPQAVLVIDALASNDFGRLFRTVQLTNTGIAPGSGVKNSRKELSINTLGVPTVALGVPTVVDVGKMGIGSSEMVVTPKDVDILCSKVSEIIARSINVFLQPALDRDTVISLV